MKFRFYTFNDVDGNPIFEYVRADSKDQAIEKAKNKWLDVDPKSCRLFTGIL